MFAAGLVDEVRRLRELPSGIGRTARQALGYKEVLDWLHADTGSVTDAIATVQTRTRQFAKRQVTWFRNLVECRAVPLADPETAATTARRIIVLGACPTVRRVL
jgi:tRNA dimethylallyltransferase